MNFDRAFSFAFAFLSTIIDYAVLYMKKQRNKTRRISNKHDGGVGETRKPSRNRDWSIKPTQGESRFESYLAILTTLLGTDTIYSTLVDNLPGCVKIEEVKRKNDLPKTNENLSSPVIYFYKPNGDGTTHYRVYLLETSYDDRKKIYRNKWIINDPYALFQKHSSQGFCQMFAYFIVKNDTNDFINKNDINHHDLNDVDFNETHSYNTFACLKKTLELISDFPNIYDLIEKEFEGLKFEVEGDYGIPKNMPFTKFVNELKAFQLDDVNEYIASI
tara:strand:- start:3880 stop:4701 length:822 start_codon:yes stop_codon:yes gene_type:complete